MKLSEHFDLDEFDCHSGEEVPESFVANVHQLVIDVLEPLRERWGSPLVIVSGWRSMDWNRRVGGAPASTHLSGRGADVRPVSPRETPLLMACLEDLRKEKKLPVLGGLGKYSGWIHVDNRRAADGRLRRWTGKGMGSEPIA